MSLDTEDKYVVLMTMENSHQKIFVEFLADICECRKIYSQQIKYTFRINISVSVSYC